MDPDLPLEAKGWHLPVFFRLCEVRGNLTCKMQVSSLNIQLAFCK
jgi:hypothetical protein